jgi:hypothetical protein
MAEFFNGLVRPFEKFVHFLEPEFLAYDQDFVKPDAAAPDFRASVVEKRDEHTIVECDKRADEAKVRRQDRFSFFQQCLIGEPRTLKGR